MFPRLGNNGQDGRRFVTHAAVADRRRCSSAPGGSRWRRASSRSSPRRGDSPAGERAQRSPTSAASSCHTVAADGVAEPHRHAAVERRVGHGRAAGPGLRRRVPDHRGERGQHVAGGVLAHGAVAAEAAHEEPAAVGAVDQPVREGELLGLGAVHHEGEALLRVKQQRRGRWAAMPSRPLKDSPARVRRGRGGDRRQALHADLGPLCRKPRRAGSPRRRAARPRWRRRSTPGSPRIHRRRTRAEAPARPEHRPGPRVQPFGTT